MNRLYKNKEMVVSIIVFTLLFIPYLNTTPFLDGNIDFVKSYDFFTGGFDKLFSNWGSVHPPLKEFLMYISYLILGVSSFSYNIPGLVFGVLGIVFIYLFTKKLFGGKISFLASLLLATNGLYLSTGIFSLTDFMLTNLLLGALYFYVSKHLFIFAAFTSLVLLTKETGILLLLAVYFTELSAVFRFVILKKLIKFNWRKIFSYFIPLAAYLIWNVFLELRGKTLWSDWNFSGVSEKGTIYTIVHNVVTLNFINKFATQSWKQLFLLNFNWIYWLIFLVGILNFYIKNRINLSGQIKLKTKTIPVILLFCLGYIFLVLTFQTYTIPRYALPVYPFLLIGVSWSLITLFPEIKLRVIVSVILAFSLLTLFKSVDPLSISLWGTQNILGENMYGVNNYLAGNDGITYNIQYLKVAKKRTFYFNSSDSLVNFNIVHCRWIFLDPRNDIKTAKILSLDTNIFAKCNI